MTDDNGRATFDVTSGRDGGGPMLMGILNVNADSFSDPRQGETRTEVTALIERGVRLAEDGADIVDLGAESASPATPVVDASAETQALLPVLDGLHRAGVMTSVDTYKPEVAKACVGAGTSIVNDYSGLAHPELAGICADSGAFLVLTHNPAGVKNKLLDAEGYRDVTGEVAAWFEERLIRVEAHGLPRERVLLDPGIDLSKTPAQSIEVMRGLGRLTDFGLPLLVATSRKDFIGAVSPSTPADRGPGTLATLAHLATFPRVIARVHDVVAARQYFRVAEVLGSKEPVDPNLALPMAYRRQSS